MKPPMKPPMKPLETAVCTISLLCAHAVKTSNYYIVMGSTTVCNVIGPTMNVLARYFLLSAGPVSGWRITPPRFAMSVKCEQIPCEEGRAADHALLVVADESALTRGLIRPPDAFLHNFDRSRTGSVRVEVVEPKPVDFAAAVAAAVAVEAVKVCVTDTVIRYKMGYPHPQVEGIEPP